MEARSCRAMQRAQAKMLREYFSGVPVEIAECPGKIADRTRLVLGE